MTSTTLPATPPAGQPRRQRTRWLSVLLVVALMSLATACSNGTPQDPTSLRVYATTGYLADAVTNLAPDAHVTTMVGPGSDPHTYQPSTQDIQAILNADLVVWNGHNLEAHVQDILASRGEQQIAVTHSLPLDSLIPLPETTASGEHLQDPHVWNDPELWIVIVAELADKLSEVDPDLAPIYQANARNYITQIRTVHEQVHQGLSAIPAESRILISGHDAFNYFGRAYGFEVHATDFVSTQAAVSPRQLSDLADLIVEKQVRVIFQDNQANPQAIRSLQEAVHSRGWTVEISNAELYADTLGAEAGVNTYLGVLQHNADAVLTALNSGG